MKRKKQGKKSAQSGGSAPTFCEQHREIIGAMRTLRKWDAALCPIWVFSGWLKYHNVRCKRCDQAGLENLLKMVAIGKFKKGQKVIMTDKAIEHNLRRDHVKRRGRVKGFGLSPLSVRIQIDGQKTVNSYHMDFWVPV